jgi:small subunit ribosomal protein S12
MPTYHQLVKNPRIKKIHTNNVKALAFCPQKKGICMKLRIVKPKKPNSAQRKVVKLRLSTRRMIIAYIPGQGHNLQEYSSVLVSGGRAPDLPGVRYSLIKGKYDFSFKETFVRKRKLSKYGYSTKIRR